MIFLGAVMGLSDVRLYSSTVKSVYSTVMPDIFRIIETIQLPHPSTAPSLAMCVAFYYIDIHEIVKHILVKKPA